ncbi:GNAT family N-acetyltransferase [Shewanella loihica]|uniref:N-acetyltransferase domain-containing protein n=1 Tax=Shewanella loihica (strain ATCC BAA-1088 / PV-4) TaxID=323850 RepID=A3QEE2_SHELP|nr:GNAT family N-acetyltransferase [Shewanella loihica]ABO23840.1 conserved hypothetical protein [Shewanella loihica PV-4]
MQIENSERLRYEPVTEEDAQLLFDLNQDPEVMRYINGGKPSTMAEIEDYFIPRIKGFSNSDTGWGLWKVNTLASESDLGDTFIGWILVRPMDFYTDEPKHSDLEVGWRFTQASWGKGYATEAAKAVCKALVVHASVIEKPITHFSAIADPANKGSINIMTKLGMEYIKNTSVDTPEGEVEVVLYSMAV